MTTNQFTDTITITFGDQGENHVGMQKLGKGVKHGFTVLELNKICRRFKDMGYVCELINLNHLLEDTTHFTESDPASVLIIRNGCRAFIEEKDFKGSSIADVLYQEQKTLTPDQKAFMYGRVVNKHARHNLCFDDTAQDPDYENKKGHIVAWNSVPLLQELRHHLSKYFGSKAQHVVGEGNYYFNPRTCGIGYHGDAERKVVIAVRLGQSLPLHYTWFLQNKSIGQTEKLTINHGDVYIMSEKATGNDWKRKKVPTLRHAAGCAKFLMIKKKK